ncbi:MAG: hypothetical protein LBF40_08110 [Deltaproteobacteria bacterium]|nr:hypothetical protein [Deltaproteobacteria bacterium]
MNEYYDQGQNAYQGGPAFQPSFKDILRHSWPVLLESPKVILLMALFLAACQLSVDLVSNALFAPYVADFDAYAEKAADNREAAQAALVAAVSQKGMLKLALAMIIPFLASPFIGFCFANAALSLWDGLGPEPGDIWKAVWSYPKCLVFFIIISLYCFVLTFITVAMFLPWLLVYKASGAGVIFSMILLVAAGYLWGKLLWPFVRRAIFLQIFAFFHISDNPHGGEFVATTLELDRKLRWWPQHLNSMALRGFCTILLLFFVAFIIESILQALLPKTVTQFVGHFIIFLGLSWLMLAIAGFYRLCLVPPEDEPGAPQYGPPGIDNGPQGMPPGKDQGQNQGPEQD